jgi:hypothetical protein
MFPNLSHLLSTLSWMAVVLRTTRGQPLLVHRQTQRIPLGGIVSLATDQVPFKVGCPFIRHIFFIRIMNNFGLLFILLNKWPILSPKFQKIQKNPNWVEITEYHVLGLICTTQKGQQINKLDFSMFLVFFLEKLFESLHFLWFTK